MDQNLLGPVWINESGLAFLGCTNFLPLVLTAEMVPCGFVLAVVKKNFVFIQ